MFDFFRVAGFVTLTLGAAGASGHILSVSPAAAAPPVITLPIEASAGPVMTLPLPAEAKPQDAVVVELEAEVEAEVELAAAPIEPRAESLAALVRRHSDASTPSAEAECLAVATYFESKGEPLAGQLAVARVILNRAESGRFARTVCGVVRQPGQFSFVRGGGFPPIARGGNQWRTAVAIAHIAQNEMWEAPVANALFFHATRVSPRWKKVRLASVGNHVFYR